MTAPDPGLTDLIAAHRWDDRRGICECMYSPEFGPGTRYERMGVKAWAAHVALVVEQHTNGRIVELEERVDEWSADLWKVVQARDEWRARAEKADATIARVEKALAEGPLHRIDFPSSKDPYGIERQTIRAALEGEQQ